MEKQVALNPDRNIKGGTYATKYSSAAGSRKSL